MYWPFVNSNSLTTAKPPSIDEMLAMIRLANELRKEGEALLSSGCLPPKALSLGTMRAVSNPYLNATTTRRPPRSRRWSIWKKWEKLKQQPDPNVYIIDGNTIVGHPATIEKLQAELNQPKYAEYKQVSFDLLFPE